MLDCSLRVKVLSTEVSCGLVLIVGFAMSQFKNIVLVYCGFKIVDCTVPVSLWWLSYGSAGSVKTVSGSASCSKLHDGFLFVA